MGYVRPVDPVNGRMSSYLAHTRRVPPSAEAGVDYYCAIGTPIRAAGPGRVVAIGGGIANNTGRYLTIDLDDGRRVRYLHLSRWAATINQRTSKGDVVAYSGASGYGSEYFGATSVVNIPANTGGPHVHTTLWPTHAYSFGTSQKTIDFELYVDKGTTASGGGDTLELEREDEDMRCIVWKGTVLTIGPQQVKAERDIKAADITLASTGYPRYMQVDDFGISALCESYGIPFAAVLGVINGTGYSIDGTRRQQGGHFWSFQMLEAERAAARG